MRYSPEETREFNRLNQLEMKKDYLKRKQARNRQAREDRLNAQIFDIYVVDIDEEEFLNFLLTPRSTV